MTNGTIPAIYEEVTAELCRVVRVLESLSGPLENIGRRPDAIDLHDQMDSIRRLERVSTVLYAAAQSLRVIRARFEPEPHSVYCNELE